MRIVLRVGGPPASGRRLAAIPRFAEPQLLVEWSSRLAQFPGNLKVVLTPSRAPAYWGGTALLDTRAMRPRSLAASLAAHLALVTILASLPGWLGWRRPPTAAELKRLHDQKISWYYYSDELPAVSSQPQAAAKAPGEAAKPARDADRGGERLSGQVIVSKPASPDNDRQTIVQPDAPDIRITHDVRVPNIVMWAQQPQRPALDFLPAANLRLNQPGPRLPAPLSAQAERPTLDFLPAPDLRVNTAPRLLVPPDIVRPTSPVDLVKREVAGLQAPRVGVTAVEPPVPDIPNLENRVSNIKVASSTVFDQTPRLPVEPGTTAPVTQAQSADGEKGAPAPPAPPEVGAAGHPGWPGRLIAVGLDPAPAGGPISVPVGNRSGSFSAGPTGKTPGTQSGSGLEAGPGSPGGAGGNGGGDAVGAGNGGREVADIRVPGLSISGGVRPPSASIGPVVSGPPPPPRPPAAEAPAAPLSPRFPAANEVAAMMARETRPHVSLPEWKKGEQRAEQGFLPGKKVYTAYINMPNMTSQSGSWVLRFAELADRRPGADDPDLIAPVAVRKVDPVYDPDAVREKIEGYVVLYAVIHQDGKVDSVRVVRGLDSRLDQNAVNALMRWEFQPAKRNGTPVDLEAVVQIPFSLRAKTF